ncbi:MAG: hypothetical protein HY903_13025 [Deltaproteobacteria bacterium]|nr:hypothetical protein [Deltaproteobacteria bacterium]
MNIELLDVIRTASQGRWDGCIRVTQESTCVGQIFVQNGKVAWAVSKHQPENLGSFLWRLGYVTDTQLEVIRTIYAAGHGQKKLGAIVEECGFIARPLLRRGILLHTRAAIRAMSTVKEAQVSLVPGNFVADEEVLFEVAEILPTDVNAETEPDETSDSFKLWSIRGIENDILTRFADIQGYLGSAVYTSDGAVLTAHVSARAVDPVVLGVFLATAMEGLARAVAVTRVSTDGSLTLRQDTGWLVARWVDNLRQHMIAVITDQNADPAAACQVLSDRTAEIHDWISGHATPDRFRVLMKNLLLQVESEEEAVSTVRIALRERLRQLRKRHAPLPTVERYKKALEQVGAGNLEDAIRILEWDERSIEAS